ncbi:MAG: STAS domain-containing protein [Ignavibacteria bacterium]|nr:STAS domain-containing protein [Ignavibacteria bacterium]
MSTDFNLLTELHDNTLVLKTEGYINNTGGEKILQEFSKHMDGGINRVILDLEKSNVVNSIGISYLIDIVEQLNENNGKLIFTNLDPTIEKTFNIMGLFQFAEKADSVDSALE